MVVRSVAAPPTPWSTTLAEPKIHETAYVHSFSNMVGDVRVGANVLIAPGTSIRADQGSPFYIGAGTNIRDGVVVHGLEQGRVLGDDQEEYSVWIGSNVSITHKALIHGPVYLGNDCFIGFRSTVFNARIGQGCIIMMHVLIQDVEIPPGKYVPSGAVITNQQQADRLPDVQESDRFFAHHVAGINEALRSGYSGAEGNDYIVPIHDESTPARMADGFNTLTNSNDQTSTMRLSSDTLQQVRQLMAGGYQVGAEYVDERRFRTNSWKSCSPIQAKNESQAIAAIEACLAEHQGDYVRLIGIDPKGKKRVAETIIQRPGDTASAQTGSSANQKFNSQPAASYNASANTGSSGNLQQQVQQLINQGYRIGTEYADARRYRSNAWKNGPTIQTRQVSEAIATLESFLAEHEGEYVRLIGIDPQAKRRACEILIQQPGGRVGAGQGFAPVNQGSRTSASGAASAAAGGRLSSETLQQVRRLLAAGYRIGTEHVDSRRFGTNSWKSCSPIQSTNESQVLSELTSCLAEHQGEYVRLFGIDRAKQRVSETIIQRPGDSSHNSSSHSPSANSSYSANGSSAPSGAAKPQADRGNRGLAADLQQQVRQLINQGYRIGTEYADARRYRSNAWKNGPTVQTRQASEAIATLESFLAEHEGEYVRLIGIDPQAKRRAAEFLIQQPNGKVAVR